MKILEKEAGDRRYQDGVYQNGHLGLKRLIMELQYVVGPLNVGIVGRLVPKF